MPKFEFCIPTTGKAVPAGPEWFHEIKFDGYRLRVDRDRDRVRLITRGGYDWTKRFPWIAEAALKNRRSQAGEIGSVVGAQNLGSPVAKRFRRRRDEIPGLALGLVGEGRSVAASRSSSFRALAVFSLFSPAAS
jgi:hypothetical protein